ncbi:hypothetical protein DQW50_15510 [Halorubrum sp. 48-1-W]|uniref:hypothetical protein n=1 Tax=Halorubrum sp. 48-1-W TaxID=2249761 RepID=UPI000DCE54D7|nr:hypothetical protein [Halorubrum sp. 48-1-W]RAW44242.1 hypothetical protein DQW50_15510 [Halorubrum sp. 48-1-W]
MYEHPEPTAVFRPLRENGPALLVPAAWTVAASAVLGVVSTHALFVAHVVMSVLLVAFLVGSWGEMGSGALRVWKLVILAGTPVTLAGVLGFLALDGVLALPARPLLSIALYGWILLPAVGLADTGRRVGRSARAYDVGTACCVVGAVGVAVAGSPTATAVALGVVGVGQTLGIVAATVAE